MDSKIGIKGNLGKIINDGTLTYTLKDLFAKELARLKRIAKYRDLYGR